MSEPTRWLSPVPGFCETCGAPIINKFYDAKTEDGPWACMCPTCQTLGPGLNQLGTGKGQEYAKNKFGHWIKTDG